MSNVTTFTHKSHPIRIVEKEGKKYFVIRDICKSLGIKSLNPELTKLTKTAPHYDRISTPRGPQVVRLVPKEDVDKLLAAKHGEKAAALRRWLQTEVYPKLYPNDEKKAAEALVCAFLGVMDILMSVPLELQPMLFLADFDEPRRKTTHENR